MERMLVAIFSDAAKAREASDALQRMGEQSEIAVHTVRILTRERDGTITSTDIAHQLPEGTMGATAVGSLLGLLGGPLGLAVGAVGGMLIGGAADYAKTKVTADFAQEVADELTPGKSAVVANVDEESVDPVNARLQPLGAAILRTDLSDVADQEYEHEMATIKSGLAETREKLAARRGTRKARLHAKIDPVTRKIDDKLVRD